MAELNEDDMEWGSFIQQPREGMKEEEDQALAEIQVGEEVEAMQVVFVGVFMLIQLGYLAVEVVDGIHSIL